MRRLVYFAAGFMLGFLFSECALGSIRPDQLFYDARAIYDIANLRLDSIAGDHHAWIFIRVTPDPQSGSATLPGTAIDAVTGKIVDSKTGESIPAGTAQAAVVEEGFWQLLASLGRRSGPVGGRYSWMKPQRFHERKLEASDLYSPFSGGGIVLCRYKPEASGAAQFEPAYLVPLAWHKSLLLAYADLGKSPEIATPRAIQLLSDRNPIVSLLAFRSLLDANKLDERSLRTALDKSQGYQRAVFVYLAALSRRPAQDGSLEEMARWIDTGGTPDQWRWTALGIFTVAMLDPELGATQTLVPRLLKVLRDQSNAPGSSIKRDRYLQEIIQILSQGQSEGR